MAKTTTTTLELDYKLEETSNALRWLPRSDIIRVEIPSKVIEKGPNPFHAETYSKFQILIEQPKSEG